MLFDEIKIRKELAKKAVPKATECDDCTGKHCWRCAVIHDRPVDLDCHCFCHNPNDPEGY